MPHNRFPTLILLLAPTLFLFLVAIPGVAQNGVGPQIEQRLNDLRSIVIPPRLLELPDDRSAVPEDWLGLVSWNVQVGGVSTSPTAARPPMVSAALEAMFSGSYQFLAAQEISNAGNAEFMRELLPGPLGDWNTVFIDSTDSQDQGLWFRGAVSVYNSGLLLTTGLMDESGRPIKDSNLSQHPPLFSHVTAGDFDFSLINVHLTFADGDSAESAREMRHILNFLDAYFNSPGHDPDVVILGDFNLPTRLSAQTGANGIVLDSIFEDDPRFQIGERRLVATVHEPTSRASLANLGVPRNNYDHFILSADTLEEFIQARRVDPEILTAHPEDPEMRLTSGHFPVVAFFRTVGPGIAPDVAQGAIEVTAVVQGASFLPGAAPGTWITLFGLNLAPATRIWRSDEFIDGALPVELDGVRVLVNGKPAAIYFISPTQLNVQAPDDDARGPVLVEVLRQDGSRATAMVDLSETLPGLFAFAPQDRRYAAAVHPDGVFVGPEDLFSGIVPARPARPDDVILLFGTGFGPTDPPVPAGIVYSGAAPLTQSVRVLIGGMQADTPFAGLSGAGLNQLNVVIPPALPPGDHEIIVEIAGLRTQTGLFLRVDGEIVSPPPTVTLSAALNSIDAGQSVILTWSSQNATSAEIQPQIGQVPVNGQIEVSPTETTSYTITVRGPGGNAMASTTVTVTPTPVPPTVSLSAEPTSIERGQSAILRWNSQGASSIEIAPSVGMVAMSGSLIVSPQTTTTYTITARGPGGEAMASVNIVVTVPAPTVNISADSTSILLGDSTTLRWMSQNAEIADLGPEIGAVAVSGSRIVSPQQTTTYTISVRGDGGMDSASVTVIVSQPPPPPSGMVVISQIYGGGGNAGAARTNDFIELFNSGMTPADITGWSVQYASGSGSGWSHTVLSGVIQPGRYYLIQEGMGQSGDGVPLPAPDAMGGIGLSAASGKVALVRDSVLLSGSQPAAQSIADFVGYGAANFAEGTPTPEIGNSTAILRKGGGCVDSGNNASDFSVAAPAPRNSASAPNPCP